MIKGSSKVCALPSKRADCHWHHQIVPGRRPPFFSWDSSQVLRCHSSSLRKSVGDVEHFFLCFDQVAITWAWPDTEWANRLVLLLTGKALEANTYSDPKQALLAKLDISAKT